MRWNWLQLSDLHCGMAPFAHLWPRVEENLLRDLDVLSKNAGPWDLVFFTGDLVQRGHELEYQRLEQVLQRIWTRLERLGSRPQLIAVPGNHDLVRPAGGVPPELAAWMKKHQVPDEFWSSSQAAVRPLIDEAFKSYLQWWRDCPFRPADARSGVLPGDIAFTCEKGPARLGVVGLNSTFLQLDGNDYEGKLALDVRQFHGVCPEQNGITWASEHHLCLLLTHQPPHWLMPNALAQLRGEIDCSGQFAAHLFGHMHEPNYLSISEGGSTPRNRWQSASLFGLEEYSKGDLKMQRRHGYSAGRLELRDEKTALLTFWPRIAQRGQDGGLRMVPDHSYTLQPGTEHTPPISVPLLKPWLQAQAASSATATQPQSGSLRGIEVRIERSSVRDTRLSSSNGPVRFSASDASLRDIDITTK